METRGCIPHPYLCTTATRQWGMGGKDIGMGMQPLVFHNLPSLYPYWYLCVVMDLMCHTVVAPVGRAVEKQYDVSRHVTASSLTVCGE